MPSKIKTIKIIYQILGWLCIVVGVLFGLMMLLIGGAAGLSGEEGAAMGFAVGAGTGILILIFGVVFGILYLITAKGIANKKNWGKILGIIFAILMLPSIPVGTVLGIVILVFIFSDEAKEWFTEQ